MSYLPTHFMRLALPNKDIARKENEQTLPFMNINAKKNPKKQKNKLNPTKH